MVRMESVAGKMNAAARPISARIEINCVLLCDQAAIALKMAKKTSPPCMTFLRPRRSESPPPASKNPANGSE
ncbi:unannotated protein [freshwater metagenome]|uniref:Unannotated protein n=1 Tax=freshwater metagenome TaxID=449393 RepID=A0A6J6WLG0_9ZZZZ